MKKPPTQKLKKPFWTELLVPVQSLESFTDKNGLVLVVTETNVKNLGDYNRFHASFKNTEVKQNGCLVSAYGIGGTPLEAIENYASQISLTTLVVAAYTQDRREIKAPRLTFNRSNYP